MDIGLTICPLTRLQNFMKADFMPLLSMLPTWSTVPDTAKSSMHVCWIKCNIVKLSQFVDNMILYVENPKDSTKNLELMNEFQRLQDTRSI